MPEQLNIQFGGISKITLDERGVPKKPHRKGIVYSTKPLIALAKDGYNYILKGPDINIVIAELSGYLLANRIDIPVPDFGITEWGSDNFFASKELKFKEVEDILLYGSIANRAYIPNIIAFDILIANPDRNMGNFVASVVETETQPSFCLYAIDFERSRVLNPDNILTFNSLDESYWPREILGQILRGIQYPEYIFINKIRNLSNDNQVFHTLGQVYGNLGIERDILEATRRLLTERAENIDTLIRRYWQ